MTEGRLREGVYAQAEDLLGAPVIETPAGLVFEALDPVQVARAVLLDATRDPETARRWASSFAAVTADPEAWPIPAAAVHAWIASKSLSGGRGGRVPGAKLHL